MKIICRCGNSYEMPGVKIQVFQRAAFRGGWRWRGDLQGRVYTCPRHSGHQAEGK